jgi:hypothetical protein
MSLALVCAAAFAMIAAAPTTFWTPSQAQVTRLETLVKPAGPTRGIRAVSEYDRAYAGTTVSGRKIVEGRWVLRSWSGAAQATSPKIVPFGALPEILDGGCDVVTVMYDVATDKIVLLQCNGVA